MFLSLSSMGHLKKVISQLVLSHTKILLCLDTLL